MIAVLERLKVNYHQPKHFVLYCQAQVQVQSLSQISIRDLDLELEAIIEMSPTHPPEKFSEQNYI